MGNKNISMAVIRRLPKYYIWQTYCQKMCRGYLQKN